MCTIFFLSPWNKKSSFVFSFHFVQIRNKTSRKRKEKENNESDTKRLLNDVECSNMKRKSIFKTQKLANATQLKKIKIFFFSLFSLSSNRKYQMLATTWLGSILNLTKKATQNKNARLSFFHVPSQTNCFFKHLQNQNQSRKPDPPKIKLNKNLTVTVWHF